MHSLVEAAGECDKRAMEALLLMVRPDLTRVLAANLNNTRLLQEALQDVSVRIFVYLRGGRFTLPEGASESTCREYLRRWATNAARNWARLVNKYGMVTAQGRYTIPQWACEGERRPRRGIVPHQSIEGDFEGLEGEGSEDRLDRMALRAENHFGRAKVA